jgi:undecaprenyl-diphosphatase
MTLTRLHDRVGWLLPSVAMVFVLLAIGAAAEALPWDRPITEAAIDARTPDRNDVALSVSRYGSTPVVLAVAALASLAAWPKCRPLAVAIILLALARPLLEFVLKEVVGRDRPVGNRLVPGRGNSFPSGHPFAAAASWGFVPLVVALYTRRRAVWWASAIGAWGLVVLVGASRVWLGVHWASDVVGGILLAVLGVLGAERLIRVTHRGEPCG